MTNQWENARDNQAKLESERAIILDAMVLSTLKLFREHVLQSGDQATAPDSPCVSTIVRFFNDQLDTPITPDNVSQHLMQLAIKVGTWQNMDDYEQAIHETVGELGNLLNTKQSYALLNALPCLYQKQWNDIPDNVLQIIEIVALCLLEESDAERFMKQARAGSAPTETPAERNRKKKQIFEGIIMITMPAIFHRMAMEKCDLQSVSRPFWRTAHEFITKDLGFEYRSREITKDLGQFLPRWVQVTSPRHPQYLEGIERLKTVLTTGQLKNLAAILPCMLGKTWSTINTPLRDLLSSCVGLLLEDEAPDTLRELGVMKTTDQLSSREGNQIFETMIRSTIPLLAPRIMASSAKNDVMSNSVAFAEALFRVYMEVTGAEMGDDSLQVIMQTLSNEPDLLVREPDAIEEDWIRLATLLTREQAEHFIELLPQLSGEGDPEFITAFVGMCRTAMLDGEREPPHSVQQKRKSTPTTASNPVLNRASPVRPVDATAKPPNQSEDSKTRTARCDVCGNLREGTLDQRGFFQSQIAVICGESKPPNDLVFPFIATCEKCDIDVCRECVDWKKDSSLAPPDVDSNSVFGQPLRPICPTCGDNLQNKTVADNARLISFLQDFQKHPLDVDVNAAERLLGKLQEDETALRSIHNDQLVDLLKEQLTTIVKLTQESEQLPTETPVAASTKPTATIEDLMTLEKQGKRALTDKQYEEAIATFSEGEQLCERAQDYSNQTVFINHQAEAERQRLNFGRAARHFERSAELCRQHADHRGTARSLANQAVVLATIEKMTESFQKLLAAFQIAAEYGIEQDNGELFPKSILDVVLGLFQKNLSTDPTQVRGQLDLVQSIIGILQNHQGTKKAPSNATPGQDLPETVVEQDDNGDAPNQAEQICPACEKSEPPSIINGTAYCANCGEKLLQTDPTTLEQQAQPPSPVCSGCGHSDPVSVINGVTYCANCGEQLDNG